MKKLHRWLMTVFLVLLAYWAVSGLTLAIWDVTDASQEWNDGGGPGSRDTGSPDAVALDATRLGEQMAAAVRAAGTAAPGVAISSVEIQSTPSGPLGIVVLAGAVPRTQAFDLRSGETLAAPPPPRSDAPRPTTHNQIKNWHRGNIMGTWGIAVAMLTGTVLAIMVITGSVLYLSLWKRRRSLGRPSFFWS